MPLIHVNDVDIYYEQHGEGHDHLILIGGLSSDHQVWKSTLRHFSKHFRVLIFDNRGAGRSTTPNYPYTTEMMASDVLHLMDTVNIKRAHILGHSMGGCIAQQIALLAPERINKMIVACSRAKPSVLANMALTMREKLQAAGIPIEMLAEYVMPLLFCETFLQNTVQVKGFIQWTMQNPHPQSPIGFSNQLSAVKMHDVSNRLSEILAPTLVIAGDEDILMPKASAKIFADNIKNSKFIVISDCAHMPHVEKSREFAEHVMRFLSEETSR